VLVESEYSPAYKMLSVVYKKLNLNQLADELIQSSKVTEKSIKSENKKNSNNEYTTSENEYPIKNNVDNKYRKSHDNESNDNFHGKPDNSFLFNPSNKNWLNIVLYFNVIFEVIVILSSIIAAVFYESFLIFLIGIISVVIIHFINMLSLNLFFNIQTIRDDLSELNKKIGSNK